MRAAKATFTLLCIFMLTACSSGGDITPEQKQAVSAMQNQLDEFTPKIEELISEASENASKETAAAIEALKAAVDNADEALEDLKNCGAHKWEANKKAAEDALAEVSKKLTAALAQTKAGGLEIPGL